MSLYGRGTRMFIRYNKKKADQPAIPTEAIVLPIDSGSRGLEFLIELVRRFRPDNPTNIEQAEVRFQALLYSLSQDRSFLFSLRRALLSQFQHTQVVTALTESGITSSRGFVQELNAKLKHKILPSLQHKTDFLFVINRVFYFKTDYRWVEGINPDLWKSFFEIIGIQINLNETRLHTQLLKSVQVLSYRLANTGLEKEIINRFDVSPQSSYPFIEQNRLVNLFTERQAVSSTEKDVKLLVNNISEALYNCRQSLQVLKSQRASEGTSLAQTFLMVRIEQLIERMFIILDVVDQDQQFNTERFIQYFYHVIRNENRKNSIGEFLSNNLALLAYQISEHKGRKGQTYISSSRTEYKQLFRSAMRGGLIISFIAIIKNLLAKLVMAPFWQGFTYGTNYAFGFVLMDQTGATLATKQPAYTASALVGSLDAKNGETKPDLLHIAQTVAKVSRSQIASFAGNLILVFPLTYVLAMLWHWVTGEKIAEGAAAMRLLEDQHPWHSLALLYACFTGVFLFASGIIAGYVENHVVYGKIPERLKIHPVLSATMSKKRLTWLVSLVRRGSGAFVGSVCLGFFLGVAGPLGKFLGIPFDIRHITISAGNSAIGFYGLDNHVSTSYFITIFLGVLTIGFLNFLVSFALAFFVAVRSRGIQMKEYPELISEVMKYFRKYPFEFLLPPKKRA